MIEARLRQTTTSGSPFAYIRVKQPGDSGFRSLDRALDGQVILTPSLVDSVPAHFIMNLHKADLSVAPDLY